MFCLFDWNENRKLNIALRRPGRKHLSVPIKYMYVYRPGTLEKERIQVKLQGRGEMIAYRETKLIIVFS